MQKALEKDADRENHITMENKKTKLIANDKEKEEKAGKKKKTNDKIDIALIRQQVFDRHDDCIIFSRDEKELIACAFKFRLAEIR